MESDAEVLRLGDWENYSTTDFVKPRSQFWANDKSFDLHLEFGSFKVMPSTE